LLQHEMNLSLFDPGYDVILKTDILGLSFIFIFGINSSVPKKKKDIGNLGFD